MATLNGGIEIEGLTAFRKALRTSGTEMPRRLTAALKLAGRPPLEAVARYAGQTSTGPRSTGALARSYKIGTAGSSAHLRSTVPYAAGAEWGMGGKWSGFRRKYPGIEPGPKGRFAWRAVVEQRDEITAIITEELGELISAQGWARP